MTDKSLDQFVKDALAAGKSRAEIAGALKTAGWDEDQIKNALSAYADIDFPVAVPRPRAYGSAREAFLYVVYFALLGVVASYVGKLAFSLIDHIFQDELARQAWNAGATGQRWAIASLVVGYPIFLYLGARLAEARRKNPERRSSRIRVWLTYITLIFAALTLIGDLVAVVFQFLSGEIGMRFFAKAAVVGVISGAILWNYSRDAERTGKGVDLPGRVLAIVTTIVVAGLVAWAFTIVRSPAAARASLADEQIITDLGVITRLMDCHQTYFGATPESLEALQEDLAKRLAQSPVARGCGSTLPTDPVTGASYGYRRMSDERYSICADFKHGWVGYERSYGDGRRRLSSPLGNRSEERYIDLPERAGEACFYFNAVSDEQNK